VRLYSYYDDGVRNTVGTARLRRAYIVLADPMTGAPVAILDEHWTYAIRSAAAAMVRAQNGSVRRRHARFGLVGVGTMGENCLRCLRHLYQFDEIICILAAGRTPGKRSRRNGRRRSASRCGRLGTVEEGSWRNADCGDRRHDAHPISVSREPWVRPWRDLRLAGRGARWTLRAGRASTRS